MALWDSPHLDKMDAYGIMGIMKYKMEAEKRKKTVLFLLLMKIEKLISINREISEYRTLVAYYQTYSRSLTKRKIRNQQAIALLLCSLLRKKLRNKPTFWTLPKSSHWWDSIVMEMDNDAFKANFRITRNTLKALCCQLKYQFHKQDTNMRRCIPLEKKTAMCLYALSSSAELRTIAHLFGVGRSTLNKALHQFCNLVVSELMPKLIKFPIHETEMREVTNGFLEDWQFPQVFGAVDGCHIEVSPPSEHAVDYYNYKQFYSVILLAVCDYAYRFTFVNVGSPGRNNDSNVFQKSSLQMLMQVISYKQNFKKFINGLEIEPFLLGDSAFPLQTNLMKPFPEGPNFTASERNFNYRLSRARRVIENAFGRLKARFRCLGKRLEYEIRNVPNIVQTCCTLHNWCEISGDKCELEWLDQNTNVADNRMCTVGENQNAAKQVREHLKNYFMLQL